MTLLHRIRPVTISVLAALSLGAHAAGQVEIAFPDDTRYTDAGFGSVERGRTERSLAQYLQQLGERLPDGQVLKVEITDIDLAGWPRFGARHDIRVLRGGADWPRIALRYELLDQGRTVKAGEERLADMNYLQSSLRAGTEGDLPYEKRLLADWFDTLAPR